MTDCVQESVEVTPVKVGAHSTIAKFIHWAFIGVFAFGVSKQVDEVEELEDFALLQEEFVIAIVFLVLLFARFVYMHSTRPTVMPDDTPKRMMLLARAVHLGMYASMAMIAISGMVIGTLFWFGIKEGVFFEAVLLSHEIVFWVSINLIGLHVAGAVYHRLKGDGIWSSMVPVWTEKSR